VPSHFLPERRGGNDNETLSHKAKILSVSCYFVLQPSTAGKPASTARQISDWEVPNAGSYLGDLRRRVVAARRFAAGRSTVYRWVDTAKAEGRLEARPMRGGPKPTIRDEVEAALRRLVAADNHLTQAEYRNWLAATDVRVHAWTLGRAL
jgi:hypothetical protein